MRKRETRQLFHLLGDLKVLLLILLLFLPWLALCSPRLRRRRVGQVGCTIYIFFFSFSFFTCSLSGFCHYAPAPFLSC